MVIDENSRKFLFKNRRRKAVKNLRLRKNGIHSLKTSDDSSR
jgi:hypothetical protein